MDYCSSCRRHLNGALVCPGCGAYAPDIDPAPYARVAPAPAAVTAGGAAAGPEPGVFDTWQESGPGDETDVVAVQPVAEGRAARRRQRARWKKNQRRAVVATAVALVSGSVAMVAMDQQSGDRARAATAPFDPGLDSAEEPNGHYSEPTARPEKSRSKPTTPASERADRHDDAQQSRTAPSTSRQEVAAPPRTTEATEVSAPLPRTAVPPVSDATESVGSGVTDGSDRADAPAPTPTPTPPSANDGAGSPGPGAEEPTTPPATTDPEKLCLLVLCLG